MQNQDILLESYLRFLDTEEKFFIVNEDLLTKSKEWLEKKKEEVERGFRKNLELLKRFLLKYGVDVERVSRKARHLTHTIKSDLKARRDPKDVAAKITKGTKKIVLTELKSIKERSGELTLGEKVIGAIVLMIGLLVALFVVDQLVAPLIGLGAASPLAIASAPLASFIRMCVIAPLLEETFKRIAVLKDYPFVYTTVFGLTELAQYVVSASAFGMSLPAMVTARVLSLSFHYLTTLIQYRFHKKAEEIGEKEKSYLGYIIAVAIHASWNSLATLCFLLARR